MAIFRELSNSVLLQIAQELLIAGQTAPKTRGKNNLSFAILDATEIDSIYKFIEKKVSNGEYPQFFLRDATNIKKSQFILAVGTKFSPLGLNPCGLCGFSSCQEKAQHREIPCAFNHVDLGIAIGSIVSKASDLRVDNRIMYTIGVAIKSLNYFPESINSILVVPLSVSGKNPFFDRHK